MQNDTNSLDAKTGCTPFITCKRLPGPFVTPPWLFGTWRLSRADSALDFAPGVRMEFADMGVLRYHVDVGGSDQIVDLIFRVDGDMLHTENPAAPHSTSVRFEREGGDVLVLDFGGARAWLLRE